MELKLDDNDLEIIELLSKDAKLTSKQIAKNTGMPLTTVHNRIKKLQYSGIIEKYSIKLNYEKLGRGISAIVFIVFSQSQKNKGKINLDSIAEKILAMPECESLTFLTGEFDAILKVHVANISDLSGLVTVKLRSIFGIEKSITAIILKEFCA